MAKIYGEIASSALMTFDKSFSRSNGQPLDSTEIFYSLAAAEEYALTDVAYVGQKIVVIETVEGATTVTHYGIEASGSLKELGAIPVGDGLTVEVVDGKIQLASLEGHTEGTYQPYLVDGKIEWREPSATTVEGLDSRLTTAEEDIEVIEGVVGHAASEDVEATGLVKAVADNATAIANEATAREEADQANADAINDINTKIGDVEEDKTVVQMIADAQEAATYDDTELAGRVSAIENDYLTSEDIYDDTDLSNRVKAIEDDHLTKSDKEALQNQINTIMNNPDAEGAINSINEFTEYVTNHGTIADGMRTDINKNKEDIAAMDEAYKEADAELSGRLDTLEAINHNAYMAADEALRVDIEEALEGKADSSAVSDIDTAYKAADKAINERIQAIEDIEAEKNVINSVDTAQFKIDTDRKLTLLDIAMGKVTGLSDALDGKVNVEEGKRLMTDAEGTKLAAIEAGAQVNVIDSVDESQFGIDGDKHLTLLDVAMSKVTGLQNALDAKANVGTTLEEYGITNAYTKEETLTKIAEKITEINGGESAGEVLGQLNSYKETNDERVDTIEGKLKNIEAGAQVNKIEQIYVGDTLLEIVDKAVVIPVGAGLKASSEITIGTDGALGVGKINVDKLMQADGEYLILNGGASVL